MDFFRLISVPEIPVFGRNYRDLTKDWYFEGEQKEGQSKFKAEIVTLHFIKYYLYESRLRKRIPSLVELRNVFQNLAHLLANNRKFGKYLSRFWEIYE